MNYELFIAFFLQIVFYFRFNIVSLSADSR